MQLKIFQVDAFTDRLFGGNPAAVIPLEKWLGPDVLQKIAAENNLSETAYFIPNNGYFDLRWFTPVTEVDLCGHATLASAHVLWKHLGYNENDIFFESRSGRLGVKKEGEYYTLDFPTDKLVKVETPDVIVRALGLVPMQCYKGREDYLVVFEKPETIEQLSPDYHTLGKLKTRGVIATAPGRDVDFVSRCFFPYFGIDEDPVTGSAHTTLVPYWAAHLGKDELTAKQISRRGGYLKCRLSGNRTAISGQAVTFLEGIITI